MHCLAAVARGIGQPVKIERICVKNPGPEEVRVKLLFASVCHTDIALLDGLGMKDFARFPIVLGHEGAGIVESVGEEVTHVQKGDHVLIHLVPQCGHCEYCVSGKTNQCLTFSQAFRTGLNDDGSSAYLDSDGNKIHKFLNAGLFSQYTLANKANVCKVEESLSLDKVPLIGCCVITGYGTAIKTCKITTGNSVVIWGMGAVGLCAVMGAKAAGATKILAIDTHDDKLRIATRLGATDTLNSNRLPDGKTLQDVVHSIAPKGFDYAIECIGGSTDTVVCMCSNEVNWLLEQYKAGHIKIDELITHRMKLSQINEAMDLIRKGESIRTVIDLHAE